MYTQMRVQDTQKSILTIFINTGVFIYKTYLYNILSVLRRVLENGAAVLQILFIKAERPLVHLLQTLIPELCSLQVDQEVSVDGAALDQTHAAEWSVGRVCFNHSLIIAFLFFLLENFSTHWMLKCCRRTAKLSHAPSIANLLAQYTSLKGRPVREHEVIRWAVLAISSMALKA